MSSVAGTETYTINAINQLTDVIYANGDTQSYTYDPAGNRSYHGVCLEWCR